MPFKSEAQRRKFFAMERSGEISKHTLDKWQDETRAQKKGKLPEKVASVQSMFKTLFANPELAGAGIGGVLGGGAAAISSSSAEARQDFNRFAVFEMVRDGFKPGTKEYQDELDKRSKKSVLTLAAIGGVTGAALGGYAGHEVRKAKRAHKKRQEYYDKQDRAWEKTKEKAKEEWKNKSEGWNPFDDFDFSDFGFDGNFGRGFNSNFKSGRGRGAGGSRPFTSNISSAKKTLGVTGNEKTKAEVKKAYRAQAMKHHPDRGGDENKMKEVNNAWEEIQQSSWFEKLSFWKGFEKHAFGMMGPGAFAAGQNTGMANAYYMNQMMNKKKKKKKAP